MKTKIIKPLEKEVQLAICDYLAIKNYFFWRQNTFAVPTKSGGFRAMPKYSMNGVPDIILIIDGIFWGLEVKRPGGKQSDNQKFFEEKCIKSGAHYHLVSSLDEVISLGL